MKSGWTLVENSHGFGLTPKLTRPVGIACCLLLGSFENCSLASTRTVRPGYVFVPSGKQPDRPVRHVVNVSRTITAIGQKAGIIVSRKKGKIKYASAHDLRRSFGLRWADRVMPHTLMLMMRHEDIETTQGYYIGRNSDEAARQAGTIGWNAKEAEAIRKPGL